MWQRKQTLFMALAIICGLICLCLPVARWIPAGMGADVEVYNLYYVVESGEVSYKVAGLFATQLLTLPLAAIAILKFKNRMLQARLCLVNMLLLVIWYVLFAATAQPSDGYLFKPDFAACLPMVEIVLYFLARKGIIADEKLVKAADRIR